MFTDLISEIRCLWKCYTSELYLAYQHKVYRWALLNAAMNLPGSVEVGGNFLTNKDEFQLLKDSAPR